MLRWVDQVKDVEEVMVEGISQKVEKNTNTDLEPHALESKYFSQLDLNFVSINKGFLSTIIAYLGTPNTLLVSLNSNLSTVFAEFNKSEFWKNFNITNALNIAVVTLNKNGIFHIVAEGGQEPLIMIYYATANVIKSCS